MGTLFSDDSSSAGKFIIHQLAWLLYALLAWDALSAMVLGACVNVANISLPAINIRDV
jgi:hypothetical protein